MKIKILDKSYDDVMSIEPHKHYKPKKTNIFWQTLTKVISKIMLSSTDFTHCEVGMEKLGKKEPRRSSTTSSELPRSSLMPALWRSK